LKFGECHFIQWHWLLGDFRLASSDRGAGYETAALLGFQTGLDASDSLLVIHEHLQQSVLDPFEPVIDGFQARL
jgi:hypothetical protein